MPGTRNTGTATTGATSLQTPPDYPYYIGNGDLVIRDTMLSDKRPVHDTKIDYSQHGANWEPQCTTYFEE